jgi:uncharacterized iron-regulated membrane protein
MMAIRAAQLRRLWLNIHLWIGVGLALLLIPISISGGLLVWHDQVDALLSPSRYAVTGPQIALPASTYLQKAGEAVAADAAKFQPTALRYPESPGWPIQVTARATQTEPGVRPRLVTVFLDPPTGAVLDVVDFRSSFIGIMHIFHENLMIPQYSGRQIVGWVGVGMLILSLTGIWLWWPRRTSWTALVKSLRWTRSTQFTFNLHNMLGFWIAIPLAVVSLTGIYLSFPQTAREMMSSIAPMNPQGQRGGGFNAEIATQTELSADRALQIAQQAEPDARPLALFVPTIQRGGGNRGLSWRIQLMRTAGDETVTLLVDDRAGRATLAPGPQSGDRAASWIRWIHEGSHSGPVWAVIVFLTGVFPTLFAVTGTIMWLRKRANRSAVKDIRETVQLRPAE